MAAKVLGRLFDGKFFYSYGQDQHQGRRPYQEDFFGLFEPETLAEILTRGLLFVLADGMGGTSKGDTASIMAVEGMIRNYRTIVETPVSEALNQAMTKTNDAIFQKGLSDRRYWKMGSTCIAVVLRNGELYHVSAGDSHIYLIRGGVLRRLNEEHSVGEEMDQRAAAGLISEEDARSHAGRNKLMSFLGDKSISKVDVSRAPVRLHAGDRIVLCSDGLYGYIEPRRILEVAGKLPPQKAVEALIAETMGNNHEDQDNISIQILEVLGEGKPAAVKHFIRERTLERKRSQKTAKKSGKEKIVAFILTGISIALFIAGAVLLASKLLHMGKPAMGGTTKEEPNVTGEETQSPEKPNDPATKKKNEAETTKAEPNASQEAREQN